MWLESLEPRTLMATLAWDGNQGNGKNYIWSAWSNWSPDRVPQDGDALVFTGTKKLTHTNNMSGLSIPQVTIQSNGFNIDGEGIDLGSGGIHLVGGTTGTFGLPLAISAAATPVEVAGSRTLYLTDSITGTGGIDKIGSGVAVLQAENAFTGSTRVSGGTLQLNSPGALRQSTVDYNNFGGSIRFGTVTSAVFAGLQGDQNLSLTNASGGSVVLAVGDNGLDQTYAGALSGSGGLTKSGPGTLTLAGTSGYTGATTVNGGTLLVTGALTGSSVAMNAGTLLGSGAIRSLNLNGGAVSPGNDVGQLTILNGANLDDGTVELDLNDGVWSDLLRIADGNVALGADLLLSAAGGFNPAPGTIIPLLNNTGSGATSGEFDGISQGSTLVLNGVELQLVYRYDYDGDGYNNDVVLTRPRNALPLAIADQYSVMANSSLTISAPGVLANDTDPDGDPLTVSQNLLQSPAHGTVTLAVDGSFTYTPAAFFSGTDTLVYQIEDSGGGVGQATVTIQVISNNLPPVLQGNGFRTAENQVMDGAIRASDPDSSSLTYSIIDAPTSGVLTLDSSSGLFSYEAPEVSHTSIVRFTFGVSDGQSLVTGVATITVLDWNGRGIRPDVLAWMLEHNPGLQSNFLKTEAPDKVVLLPNGQSVPIYRLDQFLNVNFQLDFKSRVREKVNFVQRQELHLRKLMALPEFYHWIQNHSNKYHIGGRGTVSAQEAYNYFRNISRTIWVTANPQVRAPVGGGNGINAPSWAVWDQMNLFFHEACHVISIGHNSGGLSGPLAGKLRDWDRQERWDYSTIDLNSLSLPRQ